MTTLLVIDDDRLHCDLLQMALARHGYQVSTATASGREGVALFRQLRPVVTLLDLRMPDMDGLAVLKELRTQDPRAGVIILVAAPPRTWRIKPDSYASRIFCGKGCRWMCSSAQCIGLHSRRGGGVICPIPVFSGGRSGPRGTDPRCG